jgi:hypothetical protein
MIHVWQPVVMKYNICSKDGCHSVLVQLTHLYAKWPAECIIVVASLELVYNEENINVWTWRQQVPLKRWYLNETTQHHILEDHNLSIQHSENHRTQTEEKVAEPLGTRIKCPV